ncbi:MAG TPA: Lrp/AsnC family transcriptional regulator [Acidobacteriota bacterium]|nr:Lrp/AsnC family transcriptional regulator [Acidobacteriota bacterium]
MKTELDKIDQILVEHLERDARISISDLADIVDLSRPAVSERIEKLQKLGVLKGYAAVVNHNTLGNPVIAFIAARHHSGMINEKQEQAVYELSRRKEILEVHGVAGEDCLYLKVRVKDMKELNELVSSLQQPPLSMATRTTIAMITYFQKVGGIVLMGKQVREKSR